MYILTNNPIRLIALFLGGLFCLPSAVWAQCDPDITPPTLICHDDVVVGLGAMVPLTIDLEDLTELAQDNCDDLNLTVQYTLDDEVPTDELLLDCSHLALITHELILHVSDQSGNTDSCTINLSVEDKLGPMVFCRQDVVIEPDQLPMELNLSDFVDIFDNCDYFLFQGSLNGGFFDNNISVDCNDIGENSLEVMLIDAGGNIGSCFEATFILEPAPNCESVIIGGTVFADDGNCSLDDGELPLANWPVQITNQQSSQSELIFTDDNGIYQSEFYVNIDAPFEITLPSAPDNLLVCGNPYVVTIPDGENVVVQDVPLQLETACPVLSVDVSTNVLRRCFSTVVHFSYCNYSIYDVEDAYVEVTFDDFLEVSTSSVPLLSVTDDVFTFSLGDIPAASCSTFTVEVFVKCDAPLVITQCIEAHIFPDDLCDPPALWSGASIEVNSACEGDEVHFVIKNTGTANMPQPLQYLIVEDVVMYMQEPFQLDAGDSLEIEVPANGATWRLEAEQEPFHPDNSQPVVWEEGCGGLISTGMVNAFPVNNTDAFISIFCLEVTGSFDPNDKQGFPRGIGADHFIKANQDLEYLIRFQNTGNDTAFKVVIVDTLDALLQPELIRLGASSHDYRFEYQGNGIIQFIFDDILLPDSTTNLAGSQGFVKFRVAQQPDLAPGTIIYNQAAIYFDFNEPVITNQTWHTIEELGGVVTSAYEVASNSAVRIMPNPFSKQTMIDLGDPSITSGQFYLFDLTGKQIRQQGFSSSTFVLQAGDLPSGMYWYQVKSEGRNWANGKIVVQ